MNRASRRCLRACLEKRSCGCLSLQRSRMESSRPHVIEKGCWRRVAKSQETRVLDVGNQERKVGGCRQGFGMQQSRRNLTTWGLESWRYELAADDIRALYRWATSAWHAMCWTGISAMSVNVRDMAWWSESVALLSCITSSCPSNGITF